ncbi:Uncharacterized protein APZ42_028425 [Daphnia magna]|uniref:Uncharacterized protein n=1 Tax=Daphnia magna TaxID=35525 RepID=A0A164QIY1_9CRUS|nr:Uncharacterized protein APZ42_028425 [Daphnia magna]
MFFSCLLMFFYYIFFYNIFFNPLSLMYVFFSNTLLKKTVLCSLLLCKWAIIRRLVEDASKEASHNNKCVDEVRSPF